MTNTKADILTSYKATYKGTDIKKRIKSSYNKSELIRLEVEARTKFKRGLK